MIQRFLIFCIAFLSIACFAIAQEEPDFNHNIQLYRSGLFEEAFKAFSESGKFHQNVKSQYYLAECYSKGQGIDKDDKKAFMLYRKLAEKGLPVAQAKLAYCLYKGLGADKNFAKAGYWMEKALFYESVDAYTLYVLGMCYEEGLGRKRDVHKAMELYAEALSRGVDDAYVHLAYLLFSGGVINKDTKESLRIIDQAILHIGSVDDYTCKGEILMGLGDMKANLDNWKIIQSKFPYFAVNSNNDYCVKLRGLSPIPENVILAAIKQDEKKNELKEFNLSNSSISASENNSTRNITIKYEIANADSSRPGSQQEVLLASAEHDQSPVPSQTAAHKSDIDLNIPASVSNNENAFALIIANENYQDVSKVPYAINDGEVFAEYCRKTLGFPSSNVVLIKDATYNNIRREISKLAQIANAYDGTAKVLFYYAGHGIPDEATKDAYLLPVDGYGTDASTGFSLKELYAALGKMPAEQVVVLLDACFSGAQRGEGMLASARGVAIKAKPNKAEGKVVVLSAAQGNETAYPLQEEGHGLFTYFLLKKLQESNGSVSLGDLVSYIKDNVSRKSIVVNGKSQTPGINPSASLGDSWKDWMLK